jgi:hypothetical protein
LNYFQELATQLRTVYELILQLQTHEEELHTRSLSELQALARHEELIEERGKLGQFGTSAHEEELNRKRNQDFKQKYIPSVQTQLRVLSKCYQVEYFIHRINFYLLYTIILLCLHSIDFFSVKMYKNALLNI